MKVYQINVVCGSGSTGRIATDLAAKIENESGKSRIAYGRGVAPKFVDSFKMSNKLDLYVHALLTRLTDKHGLYSNLATKRLIKDICKYAPDIIHLHNIHGYYLNYEKLFTFLKEYNKPIVWTLHDCWAFTGHCAHFDYVGCNKWKKQCFECPQKDRYPNSILADNSENNFKRKKKAFNMPKNMTIVTVSEWLKDVTSESFLKKYSIKKISNGIDLTVMKPTNSDIREKNCLNDKKIILGVASAWEERKGLYTFYKLAKHLPEEYQVVLIGLNAQQMQDKPESILGIQNIANPKELAAWYSLADIYLNASVEETMGLTTVEALACGAPVIVMDSTASPELVNETCGLVVEPENLDQLLKAINKIKELNISKEACRRQAAKYEKNSRYAEYIQLYKKLWENECI